jgi:hypothetical protein
MFATFHHRIARRRMIGLSLHRKQHGLANIYNGSATVNQPPKAPRKPSYVTFGYERIRTSNRNVYSSIGIYGAKLDT